MYRTNIETQLKKIKQKSFTKSSVYELNLISDFDFNLDKLDNKNIFHISDIKKTCIDYRLRFLNSKFFKGDFPDSTLKKIELFKKDHRLNIFQIRQHDNQLNEIYFLLKHKYSLLELLLK